MNTTLLSILAGLGSMFGWGTSDFLANQTSEKIGSARTFFWSQLAGLGLIGATFVLTGSTLSLTPLLAGLVTANAVAYAIGYLFFYKGFEIGNVAVVSAVVHTQVLFVIGISLLRGQRLTPVQIPALLLLLVGVFLVSVNLPELKAGAFKVLTGVKETLVASTLFGFVYWPLNEYLVEKTSWISVSLLTKFLAILFTFGLLMAQKQTIKLGKQTTSLWLAVAAVGALEAVGVLSASFGTSYGDGIIVAPISSALTIVTVALAMIFTKERINRTQALGIAMVVGGIVLTAL